MINVEQLRCPNCNIIFGHNTEYNREQHSIILDKTYYYDVLNLLCYKCKKQICAYICNDEIPVLWKKQEEYYYNDFVKNKDVKITQNKNYLYFYFPIEDKTILDNILNSINLEKIDAIITKESFKELFNWNKEICILPDAIYQPNKNTLFPNYFAQKIIERQSEKFDHSNIFSTYYTFIDKFSLIYQVKNWNKLREKMNQ